MTKEETDAFVEQARSRAEALVLHFLLHNGPADIDGLADLHEMACERALMPRSVRRHHTGIFLQSLGGRVVKSEKGLRDKGLVEWDGDGLLALTKEGEAKASPSFPGFIERG